MKRAESLEWLGRLAEADERPAHGHSLLRRDRRAAVHPGGCPPPGRCATSATRACWSTWAMVRGRRGSNRRPPWRSAPPLLQVPLSCMVPLSTASKRATAYNTIRLARRLWARWVLCESVLPLRAAEESEDPRGAGGGAAPDGPARPPPEARPQAGITMAQVAGSSSPGARSNLFETVAPGRPRRP